MGIQIHLRRTLLNLMHEIENVMPVHEFYCPEKKSKADKLTWMCVIEITMPIKWIWTLLIEFMMPTD